MVPLMIALMPSRTPISRAISGVIFVVGRFAEIFEALAQVVFADDGEQRRLLELDVERLIQCGVEDRIAGLISEVGEDDRVFLGNRRAG